MKGIKISAILMLLLMWSCSPPPGQLIQGHWQGHSGDGTYLELIADADSIFLYDTYRKTNNNYQFPKGSFAYQVSADTFLVMHADQSQPGVIRFLEEDRLQIGDGRNGIVFHLIKPSEKQEPVKILNSEAAHQFRLAMIEREAKYIVKKRQLKPRESEQMVKQLMKEENDYYKWLSALR